MEILLGKILTNYWKFVKFINIFHRQHFAPYSTYVCTYINNKNCVTPLHSFFHFILMISVISYYAIEQKIYQIFSFIWKSKMHMYVLIRIVKLPFVSTLHTTDNQAYCNRYIIVYVCWWLLKMTLNFILGILVTKYVNEPARINHVSTKNHHLCSIITYKLFVLTK